MATLPATVDITCPRNCGVPIVCTLETSTPRPKPGQKPEVLVSITDLADRFAEHYANAGHNTKQPTTFVDQILAQIGNMAIDPVVAAAHFGLTNVLNIPHGSVIDGVDVPCDCGDASQPHDIVALDE